MKILLSIKPEYVNRIFNGEKKFEYRRNIFKNKYVDTVVVYATKPIGMVVGEFKIGDILVDSPELLWNKTKDVAGIDEEAYRCYFKNKDKGFAIEISSVLRYDQAICLSELNPKIKTAPQSFIYLN